MQGQGALSGYDYIVEVSRRKKPRMNEINAITSNMCINPLAA